VLALVVIGGGAYGLTAAFSGHGTDSTRSVADQGTQAISPPASATSGGGQPSASPLPSTQAPAPTAVPSSPGTAVTVAAAAATDPAEPGVVALLGTYFAAINQHDYTEYQSVLDQQLQQGDSLSSFQSGYGTTTDSAETLTGISDTGSGQVAASVTFVSHQDPADSPSDSSCTDWGITLYLVSSGDGYVIGSPPSAYHASYQSC
jgi:hypothetical protein